MILDRSFNPKNQQLTISYVDKSGNRQYYQKYLHHITDNYIRVFSEEYNLPYDKVKKSAEYIVNQSTNSLREGIRISLDAMRKYFPDRGFSVIDETSDDFWGV